MDLTQGAHQQNHFVPSNNIIYGNYKDNTSGQNVAFNKGGEYSNYLHEDGNKNQISDMQHVANEIGDNDFMDLTTSETQLNSNQAAGSTDLEFTQKSSDFHGNSYRSQQKSKYVRNCRA